MATFCNMAYTWNANKIKTSESITGVMSGYGFTAAGTTYDNEDRLTGFLRAATSGPALLSQSWNLTAVGDWTSVTTNGTAQSRTHGPTHELLTAGGQNVATDVKGNITTLPVNLRPAGATTAMNLTWDSDNKLQSADIGANGTADVNFQYDALGRRVARTGTGGSVVYVQMDQQTIADYPVGGAATTPTFRYVYASYIDEPVVRKTAGTGGTLVYFHRNHQYSVTAVTTSTGAIAERYAYTAYGQPTILNASGLPLTPQSSTLSNRYSYTGREWDATLGLHHFRARWMSPSAGRFILRDPLGYPAGTNQYDPGISTDLVDPYGFAYIDPAGNECDPKKTCKIWICAHCGDTSPIIQFFQGEVHTVGHGSLCWNCQQNYGRYDEDPSMPDEPPWNNFDPRMNKRGCAGLWPGGIIKDDWEYMDQKCTHHTPPVDVCPKTMAKAPENSNDPSYQCRWVLLPDLEDPKQANCIVWACRMYRGTGLPFPEEIIDPWVFCNNKRLSVTKRIPRKDWPYR